MLHNIHTGKVLSYQDGTDRLIYLATTTQYLVQAESIWAATDRNAVLSTAEFSLDDDRVTDMTDWHVMSIEPCFPVPDHPDRIERRMAEFLVHGTVPFENLLAIGVKSANLKAEVDQVLGQQGSSLRALVRPAWYF